MIYNRNLAAIHITTEALNDIIAAIFIPADNDKYDFSNIQLVRTYVDPRDNTISFICQSDLFDTVPEGAVVPIIATFTSQLLIDICGERLKEYVQNKLQSKYAESLNGVSQQEMEFE